MATANTHMGELLTNSDGLSPFTRCEVDVLLMQELVDDTACISRYLAASNYILTAHDRSSGLAIAVHEGSTYALRQGSVRQIPLQAPSALRERSSRAWTRLRPRNLLMASVQSSPEAVPIAVSTAHPIVFARWRARAAQVRRIAECISGELDAEGPLIFGADMNHYPGPREVDRAMYRAVELQLAQHNSRTWEILGSRHEWLGRLAAGVTGRSVESFGAELDILGSRSMTMDSTEVINIASDHKAIMARFSHAVDNKLT